MSTSDISSTGTQTRYKRKLRNYLVDAGLQVRYTAIIIVIAILVTSLLGFKIYESIRETSKIIEMTGLVDQTSAKELQEQFRSNDRMVIFGIVGFGVVLVLSIFVAGIWITHKVAGPLYNIGRICNRVRDNQLSPPLRATLRRGDELREFYSNFREMYEALRGRATQDVQTLGNAIAVLEANESKAPQLREILIELKELRRQKEQSLESGG